MLQIKKGEMNWILVMAIVALTVMVILILMSTGIVGKFLGNVGVADEEIAAEKACRAGLFGEDADSDGYKDEETVQIGEKEPKSTWCCDGSRGPSNPEKTNTCTWG